MAFKWLSSLFSSSFSSVFSSSSSSSSSSRSSYSPFSSTKTWPTLVTTPIAAPTPILSKKKIPFANPVVRRAGVLDVPVVRAVQNVRRTAGLRLRRRRPRIAARRRVPRHANGLCDEAVAMVLRLGQAGEAEHAARAALTLKLQRERSAAEEARVMISRLQMDKASIEKEARQYRRMIDFDAEKMDILNGRIEVLEQALEEERAAQSALHLDLESERSACSSAAKEAMAMMLRINIEKASIELEARQYGKQTNILNRRIEMLEQALEEKRSHFINGQEFKKRKMS